MRRAARHLSAHRSHAPRSASACPCCATRTPHSLWRAQHAHPNSARSSGHPAGPNAHPAGPGAPVHQEALAARARRRALRIQAAHAQLARQALQVGVAHEARLARPRHRCEAVRRMRSGAHSSDSSACRLSRGMLTSARRASFASLVKVQTWSLQHVRASHVPCSAGMAGDGSPAPAGLMTDASRCFPVFDEQPAA